MGRQAFGPKKKKACDTKHCLKAKQVTRGKSNVETGLKHPRAF